MNEMAPSRAFSFEQPEHLGQNCIKRCEVIEPDPSIANPDRTRRHVVSDVGLCPELSPLIEDLNPITAGQLSRFSVDPGYPKLRRSVVFGQRRQGSSFVVEGMESASVFVRSSAPADIGRVPSNVLTVADSMPLDTWVPSSSPFQMWTSDGSKCVRLPGGQFILSPHPSSCPGLGTCAPRWRRPAPAT
jgi:hypothetical protein